MDIYFPFALIVFVLVLIPGSNVVLIVAMSLVHGTWVGLISVAGTTTGLALQLLAAVFGAYLLIFFVDQLVLTVEQLFRADFSCRSACPEKSNNFSGLIFFIDQLVPKSRITFQG